MYERKKGTMEHHQKKTLKNWTLGLLAVGAVAFIGWWGVVKMDTQNSARLAASSENALAPDFTLPATTGSAITLSDFRGKKNVLVYFNEGLSCQPCFEQIPELEKAMDEFESMNVAFISVAFDPVEEWKETIEYYKITTPVLSYVDAKTEEEYNLLPFSMGMGRRAGHTFVLVDTDGDILWRKDYWPGRGMMVAGGSMFVEAQEIVREVREHLAVQ